MESDFKSVNKVKMEDMPARERPYERFDEYGVEMLTDTELLAVMIKTGTRKMSALDLASRIIALDPKGRGPGFLCNIPVEDLLAVEGIGKVKAMTIKCAVELGRRAARNMIDPGSTIIDRPSDVAEYLGEEMQYLECEELRIILLNAGNKVLRVIKVAAGSVKSTLFSPKDIFKDAIKYNAAAIILVHNHPSGNPQPSVTDIETTAELEKLGKELDIQLLDHVVLSRNGHISVKMSGTFA